MSVLIQSPERTAAAHPAQSEGRAGHGWGATLGALLLALLPKCPMCLAGYLALASGLGLGELSAGELWRPLWGGTLVLLAVGLGLLLRRAWRAKRMKMFALACAGAALVGASRWFDGPALLSALGMTMVILGGVWVGRRARGTTRAPEPRA